MLKVFKLHKEAKLPTRNKKTDAGLDLYALADIFLPYGTTRIIPTGVAIEIPEGFVGKIEDRSGMAAKGLRTGAGVIDTGYAGEVGVVLHNLTCEKDYLTIMESTMSGYQIKRGDKIAQILLYRVETPDVIEVEELWTSERGSAGYGSSGR